MADYNSKYSGEQVEALLDQVASGNAGGGAITEAEIAAMGFTKNEGTITEVKMNGASKGTSGVVNLGDVPSKATVDDLVDVVNGINDDVADLTKNKENTIADLEAIRDGASKGATAVQPSSLATVATSGSYDDLKDKPTVMQGPKGEDGVGVQSVAQTTTSNADGGSNVVTVTLTDGTKSTFTVKNGSKGSTGATGAQGPKGDKGDKGDTGAAGANGTNGKDGAAGATFTPSVDSAGNLSWTNNKGLTNPPTVNIKGPKGDKGDAGEGGGSGGGGNKEIIEWSETNLYDAEPNKIYICDPFASLTITLAPTDAMVEEWVFHIANCSSLILPDNVLWAGDEAPNMPENGSFGPEQMLEVSIVKTRVNGYGEQGYVELYKAVGVLFKKE